MNGATDQRGAVMKWEVLVPGFQPLPVRDREIAEIVRKKLARIHGTLDITIQEKR